MDAHTHPSSTTSSYGVYDILDRYGNHEGVGIGGSHDIRVSMVRAPGLLDIAGADQEKWMAGLSQYFHSSSGAHALKRRALVVVQTGNGCHLPRGGGGEKENQRPQIEGCFAQCKTKGLLEDYVLVWLAAVEEKTMNAVQTVIIAAERSGLGRRDLFVAVGDRTVTDIVGFAAAIYRRSTPWISIPTDPMGVVLGCAAACHGNNELSLHYTSRNGARVHRDVLTLSHPPIATFYDPASLVSPWQCRTRRFWAELISIAAMLGQDSDLFLHVETHIHSVLAGKLEDQVALAHVVTAIDLAAASSAKPSPSPMGRVGGEAARAIRLIKGSMAAPSHVTDEADCLAMAIGVMAALSTLKGKLSSAGLERILSLLRRAELHIHDRELEPGALWEHMVLAAPMQRPEHQTAPEFLVPGDSGHAVTVTVLRADVGAALSVLGDYDRSERWPIGETWHGGPMIAGASAVDATPAAAATGQSDWAIHGRILSEDVRYRVVSVVQLFDKSNPMLIRDYCTSQEMTWYKKKILVVVDNYSDDIVPLVSGYFESHSFAVDSCHVLAIHVLSTRKDMSAVLAVVDVAVEMGLSWRDLVVVVGGGTLMDIVGFASSMFQGGIPYVRIPTTLLGMIDAGVGVKVGVNFQGHKSTIGRYFAPRACLNDQALFLSTLPARQLACGLAEAIKMAVVKSPRILELIERYCRLCGREQNLNGDLARELMRISIRGMLEELQPNLYEEDLRRLVDFGHEFGHIIEARARHELPHGECVTIGMAISSSLAYRKGILARHDLERILNCILNMHLPIVATRHDCCDADVLWAKISTDGLRHKDGMLHLVVPKTIGEATFLDRIADIDTRILTEVMHDLRRYADRHRTAADAGNPPRSSPLTNTRGGVDESSHSLPDGSPSGGSKPLPSTAMTAAIIGASGDIGSHLVRHLMQTGNVRVICSVRQAALHRFKKRVGLEDPDPAVQVRILIGDLLDLAKLQTMLREADVLYNMAGAVTLGSRPDEFAAVLALNGFAQAIIAHFVQTLERSQRIKVVYPSTQRIHLITSNAHAHTWVRGAAAAYAVQEDAVLASQDVFAALEVVAEQFLASHPLPDGVNVYEMSKLLGEFFTSQLPQYSLMRISSAYGPGFARGFIYRAIESDKPGHVSVVAAEKRDFIYHDDLMELLWKTAMQHSEGDYAIFDAASGESINLQQVWATVRAMTGDSAIATFQGIQEGQAKIELRPNPSFARRLLGREFTPLRVGLRRTIDYREAARREMREKDEDSHGKAGIQEGSRPKRPHVIVMDVGATYLRVGIMGPQERLLYNIRQYPSPSKQRYPRDSLSVLQERLLDTVAREVGTVVAGCADLWLEEVGIALGAVVTHDGLVQDASVLWGEPAQGYDLARALLERLPGVRLTILNDVSAAAWRYRDEGRFCLITVSSGLSNKIFNANLHAPNRLDLDASGVGGEMGHVVVEPRAVEALVQHAISQAIACPAEFRASKLEVHVHGDVQGINARHLSMAAAQNDGFALRLLEEADVPYCSCGNIADLCSYSSGRAGLRRARSLATRQEHHGVAPDDVTDSWLQQAMAAGHPLALQTLRDATYYLALRILQLAADMGLDKFIIVGGFVNQTVGNDMYLQALQHHLAHLYHASGFFRGWGDDRVHRLVRAGVDGGNDGLIGMGYFVQHLRSQYYAVKKPVREQSLIVTTRRIPDCGAREILAKVVYAGICTTDLQILRHERGLEPVILGHEGVCRVVEVGVDVKGLEVGEMIVLNPNNPLDDHDKLGHSREGLFQEYMKVGGEFLDRCQVLRLGRSTPNPTDTLIEPLSCVLAAQNRFRDCISGRNVLVVGAGFMGLLFVMMNVKMGARNVYLANRSRKRLDDAVSRRIVEPGKALLMDEPASLSSLVNKATAGEGADIVIVCVSLGQGVQAAQDAIEYVNTGGCVYLFAGFRPGDMLSLDGRRLDAWSIRAGWLTERIYTPSGKCVDVSGHRGSRLEDLNTAADLVRRDSLFFGRVVSHIISLDMLPESMLSLARDGTIRGVPARRVMIDMEAWHSVVEPAEMLPLRHLREAARRSPNAIGSGNLFREIGFDGTTSVLGWVYPPSWPNIQVSVEEALGVSGLGAKRHVIWVGTGGWVFLVDALRELMPMSRGSPTFHTCQSLDPHALQDVLLRIDDLSTAICLGISQSGKTLETVALMNALRERFDNAGLDYRQHFIWLTDTDNKSPNRDEKGGDSAIRSIDVHDWQHVSVVPLTINNCSGINAPFCAPHSMVMFLPLILLLEKDWQAMRHLYQQYLGLRDEVLGGSILHEAYSIASNGLQNIRLELDESIALAVTRLVIQLIEQALGSKQFGFNPRVQVVPIGKAPMGTGFEEAVVTLQMPATSSAVVKAMLAMAAVSVFVSSVAYYRRIGFATHPKVDLYKGRAAVLMAGDGEVEHIISNPVPVIRDELKAYLATNPQTHFVEVVYYGGNMLTCDEVKTRTMAHLPLEASGISIEFFRGEEWNHSRYQAAVQRDDTLYVILLLHDYLHRVEGISEGTIHNNIRLLQAIARATHETLCPRALFLPVRDGFLIP